MKKILVACAMGVNTSQLLLQKLKDILIDEEGIEVEIEATRINDVESRQNEFDLIVSLGEIKNLKKPFVNGVGLLTGMQKEKIVNQIKKYL